MSDPLWMRALGKLSRALNPIVNPWNTPGAPISYDAGRWLRSQGYKEGMRGPWWMSTWWYEHFLQESVQLANKPPAAPVSATEGAPAALVETVTGH